MEEGLFRTEAVVKPEWIDDYGHLNMAFYVLICDMATAAFWDAVNAPKPQAERGGAEYAVVETHVNYLDELREGDAVTVTTQLLAADAKRFHLFHRMYHAGRGYLAATNEVMALGFHLQGRAAMKFVPAAARRLRQMAAAHAALARHRHVGRAVGQPFRRPAAG